MAAGWFRRPERRKAQWKGMKGQANWYSGDPYAPQTAWPQYTENYSNSSQERALTFDNFNWTWKYVSNDARKFGYF